jgi:type I restriction enzyme S subunit
MTDEESLPRLAVGWEWSTLGEVFSEIKNGTTASQNREGRGIPVTRIETVQNARFDLRRVGYLDEASSGLVGTFRYHDGDIAFSHINSLEHVGKTALYERVPEILLHGMNLLRLRLGHNGLHQRFLHTAMQANFFREEVRNRVGRAVNQVSINQKKLSEVPLPIAPLAEQERILTKLDLLFAHVNSARDHLSCVPTILRRFRQAVLAAACSGRLTEAWRSLAVSANPSSASESSEYPGVESLFDLPPYWRWVSFESVCEDITVGHVGPMAHEYQAAGIPFLRSQNVREFRFDPKGLKYVSREFHLKLAKSALHPGDVAVVRSGYAGVACVIPNSIPEANCADLVIIRPSVAALDPHYACIFINSNAGRAHVDEVKVGIAQSHFNIGAAKKTPLPLPPIVEQQEIVRRVGALFTLADTIERRTSDATLRTDKLTQSILAKAFRGELVPTEAELARREGRLYEPASVLLERIKKERASETKPSRVKRSVRKS